MTGVIKQEISALAAQAEGLSRSLPSWRPPSKSDLSHIWGRTDWTQNNFSLFVVPSLSLSMSRPLDGEEYCNSWLASSFFSWTEKQTRFGLFHAIRLLWAREPWFINSWMICKLLSDFTAFSSKSLYQDCNFQLHMLKWLILMMLFEDICICLYLYFTVTSAAC